MARPTKQGLDYFPLDVQLDDKFHIIEAEHGLEGFAIVIKLFQKIYSEGYYYEWNEMQQILFSKSVSVDRNRVVSIVNDCIKWKLFDEEMYKKYKILTSRGIQRRFVQAIYKRTSVEMIEEYLLIDVSDRRNVAVISISDAGNSDTTIVSDGNNSQSKVKKSKVKESKEKESKVEESNDTVTTNDAQEIVDLVTKNINPMLNSFEIQLIAEWLNEHPKELIIEAIKETALNKATSVKYTDAILRSWKAKNIRTLQDLQQYSTRRQTSKSRNYEVSAPEWLKEHEERRRNTNETIEASVEDVQKTLKQFL